MLKVLISVLKRDFILATRYRFEFLLRFFSSFFSVVLWYYMSLFLKPQKSFHIENNDYFSYVIIGMMLLNYVNLMLYTFSQKLKQEQNIGTFEYVLASPNSPHIYIFSLALFELFFETIHTAIFILIAFLFGLNFKIGSLIGVLLIFFLSMVCFSSLGVIAASFILVFKRGEPVTPFITAFFALTGNIFFPIEVLPKFLKVFSLMLPLSYSVSALRKLFLENASFVNISFELTILLLFSAIFLPLSVLSITISLKLARKYGLLAIY